MNDVLTDELNAFTIKQLNIQADNIFIIKHPLSFFQLKSFPGVSKKWDMGKLLGAKVSLCCCCCF